MKLRRTVPKTRARTCACVNRRATGCACSDRVSVQMRMQMHVDARVTAVGSDTCTSRRSHLHEAGFTIIGMSTFVTDHFLVATFHCGLGQTRIQTEVLGHSLVRSLAPLTRSLTPDCSLRSRPPLRSLVRSLAHFAHSLARGKVNY